MGGIFIDGEETDKPPEQRNVNGNATNYGVLFRLLRKVKPAIGDYFRLRTLLDVPTLPDPRTSPSASMTRLEFVFLSRSTRIPCARLVAEASSNCLINASTSSNRFLGATRINELVVSSTAMLSSGDDKLAFILRTTEATDAGTPLGL